MMNSYIKKVAVVFITSVQISCCLAEFGKSFYFVFKVV